MKRPAIRRRIGAVDRAEAALRVAQHELLAVERELAQLQLRHLSAAGEIERCRRDHGELRSTNIRLAHQAEQAEAKRDAAVGQHAHVARLAALYREQLLTAGVEPRGLEPVGEL